MKNFLAKLLPFRIEFETFGKRDKILSVVLIAIIFVTFLGIVKQYEQNTSSNTSSTKQIFASPTSKPTPSPTLIPTPTPVPLSFPNNFSKKLFDKDEKINGRTYTYGDKHPQPIAYYPAEVLSVLDAPEDQLIGLKCLSRWNVNEKTWQGELITNPRLEVTDKVLQTLAPIDKEYGVLTICDTESTITIVVYREAKKKYDFTIIYHIAISDTNNALSEVTSFSPQIPYPWCKGPLELTKTNHLFVECDEGDGTSEYYLIYDVDMTNKTNKLVSTCDMNVEIPTLACH